MVSVASKPLKRLGSLMIDILLVTVLYFGANYGIVTPILNTTSNYSEKIAKAKASEDEYYAIATYYNIGDFGYFQNDKGEIEKEFIIDIRFVDLERVLKSEQFIAFSQDEEVKIVMQELYVIAQTFELGTMSGDGKVFTLNPIFTEDYPIRSSAEFQSFIVEDEVHEHVVSLYPKAVEYGLGRVDTHNNFFYGSQFYVVDSVFGNSDEYQKFIKDSRIIAIFSLMEECKNLEALIVVCSLFIACMLALFLPILFFKNGKSIGKFVFKLAVVNKYDYKATIMNMLIRTFVIFAFELGLFLVSLVYSNIFMVISLGVIFLSITMMLFTKDKKMLHDVVSATKVVDAVESKIFDTLEKRNEYVLEMQKEEELRFQQSVDAQKNQNE